MKNNKDNEIHITLDKTLLWVLAIVAVVGIVAFLVFSSPTITGETENSIFVEKSIETAPQTAKKFYTLTNINIRTCASTTCEIVGTYLMNTELELPYNSTKDMPQWVELNIGNQSNGFISKINLSENEVIPVEIKTEEKLQESNNPVTNANQNIDSTCLSFHAMVNTLSVLPVKKVPVYTRAELEAIKMASQGEYQPAITSAMAKKETAENEYLDTITANNAQKQDLAKKYSFCYEYLAKTYGYIIN